MKKNMRVSILAVALVGSMALGAGAATVAERVSAELRPDITVRVNGDRQTLLDKNGNAVYPITYGGTTYLPVWALGDAMGLDVEWNSRTQTVNLYTKTNALPDDLTTVKGHQQVLDKLEQRVKTAETDIEGLKPGTSSANRLEQYRLFSQDLFLLDRDMEMEADSLKAALRAGWLTTGEYQTLCERLDGLDRRLGLAWDGLEKKTVNYDGGKTDSSSGANSSGYLSQIEALDKRADELVKEVQGFRPSQGQQTWRTVERKIHGLENEIDALEETIERAYRSGTLTAAEYRSLDQTLDRVEDKIDDLDDWYDDDWDDDWDD